MDNKDLKSDFEKVMVIILVVAILHLIAFVAVNLKH